MQSPLLDRARPGAQLEGLLGERRSDRIQLDGSLGRRRYNTVRRDPHHGHVPSGVPTPTVHTILRPPRSLMAQLDPAAFDAAVAASAVPERYAGDVDPESAKEMLAARIAEAAAQAPQTPAPGAGAAAGAAGGMDWGEAAKLGTRVLTSSTTSTLLRGVLAFLGAAPLGGRPADAERRSNVRPIQVPPGFSDEAGSSGTGSGPGATASGLW